MQHWGTQWQILLCFQCRIQAEEIQSFNKTWSWTCKYSLQVWKDKAHSFLWPGCRTSMVKSLREFRKCSSQFHNPWIWKAWAIGSLWFWLLVYPGQRSSLEGKKDELADELHVGLQTGLGKVQEKSEVKVCYNFKPFSLRFFSHLKMENH